MRIERNAICALETAQHLSSAFRQDRRRAESAVDVEPEFFFCGEVRQFSNWIDRAGVSGAGVRNHAEWARTFRAIIANRGAQALDRQSKIVIALQLAYLLRCEAYDAQRAFHRGMRLIREINR